MNLQHAILWLVLEALANGAVSSSLVLHGPLPQLAPQRLEGDLRDGASAPALDPVTEVEWEPLRKQCRRLVATLDTLNHPVPKTTIAALERVLRDAQPDPDAASKKVQDLLDQYCLVNVTINPESRVKAARGPAAAALVAGRETVVLVKVHNEAGVTHALRVGGPEIRDNQNPAKLSWLDLATHARSPLGPVLSGSRVEYRVFGLTAHQTGKREATLRFDVGQGTQDLGFRAEVPILFHVGEATR
jgi:hypothetical protein